tara:strand:+ start:805 stop:1986 length:1182 start_codon:yes stop_codon:yes gene_type:complete
MKSIKDLKDLNDKKVLLRLDLNVPLKDGKVTDNTRIDKIIPTIDFLLKQNTKIIILSHVGRPRGKIVNGLSLEPICIKLENIINTKIKFLSRNINEIHDSDLFKDSSEKIIMLENLRFFKEEEENNENFSKHLSKFGDIYVNDAFSCSHRAHSSIDKITKFIPSYSGLQLDTEIYALEKITSDFKKPVTCIIGGSKISSKINIIKNLIKKFNNIIIVGGMANNVLEYKGHNIGKSIKEMGVKNIIKDIFELSIAHDCKIYYPEDVMVSKEINGSPEEKKINEISDDDLILDIGPNSINSINSIIENSKTILWNGPAGYFENPKFARGSLAIGKKIAEKNKLNNLFSVAGGGDTVFLLNNFGLFNNFNFVSTAGGAFLEYLEGKELPGIKALNQ